MIRTTAVYRGWLSTNERGELYLIDEGALPHVLARDRGRFGRDVRIRFFTSTIPFPREQLKGHPWPNDAPLRVDRGMRAANYDLFAALRPLIGKFLQLEIEWRR